MSCRLPGRRILSQLQPEGYFGTALICLANPQFKEIDSVPISTTVLTHAYTLVFTRELPDTMAVRQVKRTLRELFETDEVTTSDSRKFSFVTTIREERVQVAVDLFGRD